MRNVYVRAPVRAAMREIAQALLIQRRGAILLDGIAIGEKFLEHDPASFVMGDTIMANKREPENYVAQRRRFLMSGKAIPLLRNIIVNATY